MNDLSESRYEPAVRAARHMLNESRGLSQATRLDLMAGAFLHYPLRLQAAASLLRSIEQQRQTW